MENQKNEVEYAILNKIKKIEKRFWIVFFSSLVWGIFAHGMALFNKYALFDDAKSLFGIGSTVASGRWGLEILGKFYKILFGGGVFFYDGYYSLPLFNGLISIICIAFSAYLIVDLLNIRKIGSCISISGMLVTFPVVACMLGYMFTAPYYAVSILFAAAGIWILKNKSVLYFAVGAFMIAFSIGIYQAFLPFILSLALIYFMSELIADTSDKSKELIKSGLYIASAVIAGVLLYFLINKFFLFCCDVNLLKYKGISTMGQESITEYLSRIKVAYYYFFSLEKISEYTMFPFRIKQIYVIVLAIIAVLSLYMAIKIFKKNTVRCILFVLSGLLLPLAFNFIFVMCEFNAIYNMMLYGQAMIFVYLVLLIDNFEFPKIKVKRIVYYCGTALILFTSFSYGRYDNINYLRAEYLQRRINSYLTVLIARIRSVEGYKDELPVCYVGANCGGKEDLVLKELSGFKLFRSMPYIYVEGIMGENSGWLNIIDNSCAFTPELVDDEYFLDLPEVIDMPCYPDDGSIKVINDTVVVKFLPVDEVKKDKKDK